jgi:hypothetical protein
MNLFCCFDKSWEKLGGGCGEICAILTTFENDTLVPVVDISQLFQNTKKFQFFLIGKRPIGFFWGG